MNTMTKTTDDRPMAEPTMLEALGRLIDNAERNARLAHIGITKVALLTEERERLLAEIDRLKARIAELEGEPCP